MFNVRGNTKSGLRMGGAKVVGVCWADEMGREDSGWIDGGVRMDR